jgi:hypothetical protein
MLLCQSHNFDTTECQSHDFDTTECQSHDFDKDTLSKSKKLNYFFK